jgi:hypothetical protein
VEASEGSNPSATAALIRANAGLRGCARTDGLAAVSVEVSQA